MDDTTRVPAASAPPPDEYAIERFLAGEAAGRDADAVRQWAGTMPDGKSLADVVRAVILDDARPTASPVAVREALWQRLKLGPAGGLRLPGSTRPGLQGRGRAWIAGPRMLSRVSRVGVAAGVLGAALVAAWIGGYATGRTTPRPVPMRTIAAAVGQRVSTTLGDGTRVVLNAGSTLRVPRDLSRSREVELDGEALFAVEHRTGAPFVVRTASARVTVLGTTFAIRRYREDHAARVVVTEGRVAVHPLRSGAARDVVLGARMLARVSDTGEMLLARGVDTSEYNDWAAGRLIFHDTPLSEALPVLERRYGIVIHLRDSTLAHRQLTMTITDDPSGAVLDVIALLSGARYVRDGNTVTFLPTLPRVPQLRREAFPSQPEVLHGK